MKLLLQYLKPYRWLIVLALFLAAVNQVFSLFSPMIIGQVMDKLATHPHTDEAGRPRTEHQYIMGVLYFLSLLIGTAMVSRIAKAFQDYVVNVIIQKFGAKIFTDGLRHSMRLPYQEFEDQRSGETLSILTKVRADTEKFIGFFINVFFGIIVSVVFVSVYAASKHWSIVPTYVVGMVILAVATSILSRKIKQIQKNIVKETTVLAGTT
ncbi:MAG TPA: ABC transporter transmembrane domain-containing protein, partial [Chitinophagaceae bacterium]|nr:ABC transporter transmembrane domain-containing protein [Chitinophagaceae bacterium]